ncbi:MAG: hypothetical protein JWN35_1868 [Frankiales bacterium]|nr:hypothetical protein [Frankiales bacterium]
MTAGTSDAMPLQVMLERAAATAATGSLRATSPAGAAEVLLRAGGICAVTVPGARPALGRRLVSAGLLAPQAGSGEPARTEDVDVAAVEVFAREQLVAGLIELIYGGYGGWTFHAGEPARADVTVPVPVPEVLAEAGRREPVRGDVVPALGAAPPASALSGPAPGEDLEPALAREVAALSALLTPGNASDELFNRTWRRQPADDDHLADVVDLVEVRQEQARREAERAEDVRQAEQAEQGRWAAENAAATAAAAFAELSAAAARDAEPLPDPEPVEVPEATDQPLDSPQPAAPLFVHYDTDTASLLRELSFLGVDDEPPATATGGGPRPVPTDATPKKRKGLFGR